MKIKPIIAYLILLICLAHNTNGQQVAKKDAKQLIPGIENLKVGDIVPDIIIKKIINDSVNSARISDFKSQLLILDFWETNCASCIELFPKLNAIQQHFDSKIKILPVTWQNQKLVDDFFKTNRFLRAQKPPIKLPCVVEDKILASYFRHEIISHEVWIYKGVVKAITLPEYVNIKNIQMILDGKAIDWPIKSDAVDFDINQPLLSLSDKNLYNNKNGLFSYSILTGQREGLNKTGGLNFTRDSLTGFSRIALFNKSILTAYSLLLFNSDSLRKDFILTPGRIALEVKNPSQYEYDPQIGLRDKWQRENEICYEIVYSKPITKSKFIELAVKDLDNRLGVRGRWEKRMTDCLVFIKMGKVTDSLPVQKKGKTISQIAFFNLDYVGKYPPAIDESGYTGKIDIGSYDGSLEGLRKQLQAHGIDLINAKRDIDVMVITENDWKK